MFLKQSTAYTFRFGPFVDDADGKTAETGLTIEDEHIRVSKNGGNFIDKAETSNSAHDEAGFYIVVLNTSDTDTVGELQIACHMSGALPVFKTFQVVEEAIYDALFAASATGELLVDVAKISGDSTAADNLEAAYDGTGYGIQAASASTSVAVSSVTAAALNNIWTTDIVEAYAGNTETACTPAELLYMIFSCVGSYAVSGDKITTYDLPGSGSFNQAMRFDMDDATNPTTRTRDA